MGDTVVLQSILMPTMFLHIDGNATGKTEVNCVDLATRYIIVPVAKTSDIEATSSGRVRGGDYLTLYQRQAQSYLHRDMSGRVCLLQVRECMPTPPFCCTNPPTWGL